MTNANTITISLVYANSSIPEQTTVCLRDNCGQAALNTLVYHIQRETAWLSGYGIRVKGVTKTDAKQTADRLFGKTHALSIITDYTAAALVTNLNAAIDAALAEANAALTKPSKPKGGFGPVIHMTK